MSQKSKASKVPSNRVSFDHDQHSSSEDMKESPSPSNASDAGSTSGSFSAAKKSAINRYSTRGAAFWTAALVSDQLERHPLYTLSPNVGGWEMARLIVSPAFAPKSIVAVQIGGEKRVIAEVDIQGVTKLSLESQSRFTVGIHHPVLPRGCLYVAVDSLPQVWNIIESIESRVSMQGKGCPNPSIVEFVRV